MNNEHGVKMLQFALR